MFAYLGTKIGPGKTSHLSHQVFKAIAYTVLFHVELDLNGLTGNIKNDTMKACTFFVFTHKKD